MYLKSPRRRREQILIRKSFRMYRCVPETVSPEARANLNMKTSRKVSRATFKVAYLHPFKFACQSYQQSFWEITFSIDPVLPPTWGPDFMLLNPPGVKVHTCRTSRLFLLLPLLLLLLLLLSIMMINIMQTYLCVPEIASPEARKEMRENGFEKYRCVPKIA